MGESKTGDVDGAYQLFLTIIALVFGTLRSNYSILYPGVSSELVARLFIRLTVIPILLLTFIWIAAKLTPNSNYAVFFKLVDWIMALNLTIGGLFMYFRDTGYIHPSGLNENYLTIVVVILVPIFVYYAVVPRYKEMYEKASFFGNIWGFVLAFLVAEVLWFSTLFFATGSFT